jgi:hypothetical protein
LYSARILVLLASEYQQQGGRQEMKLERDVDGAEVL